MDGRQLLRALMAAASENPNSLADKLQARSLQSQIQRFIDGKTRNPRWSTLEPIAKHFGLRVEAFLDDEAAEAVAIDRGLIPPRVDAAAGAHAPVPIRPSRQQQLSIRDLVLQLGAALLNVDAPARKAVGSLLADMASEPDDAARAADRIARLLAEPGNAPAPKSSASNGG